MITLSVNVVADMTLEFLKALKELKAKEVLAGFPEGEKEERKDADGNPTPITNAALGYVHDKGQPELNIPARPFMEPGVESRLGPITDRMKDVGVAVLDGDSQRADQGLHAAGLEAKLGIQNKILDGPFEPLAESTLKARARHGSKGAQEELDRREAGEDPGVESARPLNVTGQMRNAVNYVVKK